MYIDEVLEKVISTLNCVMIPASESAKVEAVKNGINQVIVSVRTNRAQAAQKAQEQAKKEEKADEDHNEQG